MRALCLPGLKKREELRVSVSDDDASATAAAAAAAAAGGGGAGDGREDGDQSWPHGHWDDSGTRPQLMGTAPARKRRHLLATGPERKKPSVGAPEVPASVDSLRIPGGDDQDSKPEHGEPAVTSERKSDVKPVGGPARGPAGKPPKAASAKKARRFFPMSVIASLSLSLSLASSFSPCLPPVRAPCVRVTTTCNRALESVAARTGQLLRVARSLRRRLAERRRRSAIHRSCRRGRCQCWYFT
jgi:hypothetical protein